MAFVRTRSGLANAHIVHGVDFVVYTEGQVVRRALAGDVGFWKAVFETFSQGRRFHVTSKGGRSQVEAIARELQATPGHRSLCAFDRDYLDLQGRSPTYAFSLTTFGYSYENDVCLPVILARAIDISLAGQVSRARAMNFISKERSRIKRQLIWTSIADQILSNSGAVFYRRGVAAFSELFEPLEPDGVPNVSKSNIRRIMRQRVNSLASRAPTPATVDRNFWRRLYGHFCWWIHFRLARQFMRQLGLRGQINEQNFLGGTLVAFRERLPHMSVLRSYYRREVGRALATF